MTTIIKYSVITLCALYIFSLLAHTTRITKEIVAGTFIITISSISIGFLRTYIDPFHVIISFLLFALVVSRCYRISLFKAIILSTISFGLGYAFFTLSTIISVFPLYIFLKIKPFEKELFDLLFHILIGVIQTLFVFIAFKSKRMRNGFHHIIAERSYGFGVTISVVVIAAYFLINTQNEVSFSYYVPLILIIACTFALLIWRHDQITKSYIKRAAQRQSEIMEAALCEKDVIISKLREDNDRLASIIHRDNKLLPAMELAVKEFTSSVVDTERSTSEQSSQLLSSLTGMIAERNKVLSDYESGSKIIIPTGFISIDALLLYMSKRASDIGGAFSCNINPDDFKALIPEIISERNLNTILADLIENAIIATKETATKNIKFETGIVQDSCYISVYDTGTMFAAEVLQSMGYKKITTHADNGGSGIGMMSTFELIRNCRASFVLEEYPADAEFAKKITIIFDKQSEFKIMSHRCAELRKSVTRPDVLLLPLDDSQRNVKYA